MKHLTVRMDFVNERTRPFHDFALMQASKLIVIRDQTRFQLEVQHYEKSVNPRDLGGPVQQH